MSNINAAKTALMAELQHAKQGMRFYAARIETFEKMLAQLDGVDGRDVDAGTNGMAGKRKYQRKGGDAGSKIAADKLVPTRERAASPAVSLPTTKGDFWKNLVGDVPMSNKDILKAATTELKIRPNPEALKKLKQRLANALTVMTKDGSIKSEGTGRARRFSRIA